jgi:hypothetical protein
MGGVQSQYLQKVYEYARINTQKSSPTLPKSGGTGTVGHTLSVVTSMTLSADMMNAQAGQGQGPTQPWAEGSRGALTHLIAIRSSDEQYFQGLLRLMLDGAAGEFFRLSKRRQADTLHAFTHRVALVFVGCLAGAAILGWVAHGWRNPPSPAESNGLTELLIDDTLLKCKSAIIVVGPRDLAAQSHQAWNQALSLVAANELADELRTRGFQRTLTSFNVI